MYRVVFMDIDGTILSSQGKIDTELIETIKTLQQRGVLFGLATGRSFIASKMYGEQFGCSFYVNYQCGMVMDGDEVIYESVIPSDIAYRLCSKTNEWGGRYTHYYGHASRSNVPDHQTEYMLPRAEKSNLTDTNQVAHRISIVLPSDQIQELGKEMDKEYFFEEEGRLEVFPVGSKWTGIAAILERHDISPEEVITVGNGLNDFEMIEAAGLGVAMGNAPEHVRNIADMVTKDSDHNGVSHALKTIFNV